MTLRSETTHRTANGANYRARVGVDRAGAHERVECWHHAGKPILIHSERFDSSLLGRAAHDQDALDIYMRLMLATIINQHNDRP